LRFERIGKRKGRKKKGGSIPLILTKRRRRALRKIAINAISANRRYKKARNAIRKKAFRCHDMANLCEPSWSYSSAEEREENRAERKLPRTGRISRRDHSARRIGDGRLQTARQNYH